MPFRYAAINGWYYTSAPSPRSIPQLLIPALLRSRGKVLWVVYNALARVSFDPVGADRALLRRLADSWRHELLPRYQRVVADGEARVASASTAELEALISALGGLAGEYLWSLAIVGGSAWKMEGALARFLHEKHVPTDAYGSVQVLLRGLSDDDLQPPAHAVQSVDWYWPTSGELEWTRTQGGQGDRRATLAAERRTAATACRAALAGDPSITARFDRLLAVAQRYAHLREEQAGWFTLAWPLLRRCVVRVGDALRADARLKRGEDVFFLLRSELRGREPVCDAVSRRRADWERQRRLVAPLTLGTAPRLMEATLAGVVNAVRTSGQLSEASIVGQPASPGRATGLVRIVQCAEDFERFQAGEVLVAKATAPAWTPLFARAAAVVTDGGTLAAHASLVAREYGIPAVVGTGDATQRL
ncbi:MAG TPA: PEP-utilizing enzyme, partial [Ktedonobacterales bacterium]|nr:PEP-utilizing enzyme [Ktedonobacterales bacterium]